MTPDFVVQLGEFTLSGLEIPANIRFGGTQSLAVHKLVGGTRVIDAMGEDPRPLEWSGLFFGQNALQRARYLDSVRKSGATLAFAWSELRYSVIISDFDCEFQRAYQIPYRIRLEPVADLTSGVKTIAAAGVDGAIGDDQALANGFAGSIGDGTLSGLMVTLNGTIAGVSSFANASSGTINSVLAPIAAVRTQVGVLQASAINVMQSTTTLGGVLPYNPIAQQAARLSNQVIAAQQSATLINLDTVMGRMATNLGSVNAGQSSITIGGGNLFNVAAQIYGDATGWDAIAKANGLTDPNLVGLHTLQIPPNHNPTGGVLRQ